MEGSLRFDDFMNDWRVTASSLMDIDQARQRFARRLLIQCDSSRIDPAFAGHLKEALAPFREGQCDVWIQYRGRGGQARLCLGEAWQVRPARELIERLAELAGRDQVRVLYPRRVEA